MDSGVEVKFIYWGKKGLIFHACFFLRILANSTDNNGVVGWCEGAVYLTSPGCPADIGLQLGKACYSCSR